MFRYFYYLCSHGAFGTTIIILILWNTTILGLDRYPIDKSEFTKLELMNEVLSWCFFAEMVIKLIGLGFRDYARDRFNLFDCMIVIISTIESILAWINLDGKKFEFNV
jgi:hypothetical protein